MAAAPGERVLILGGTAEAAALAGRLGANPKFEVTTSLAGRTREPAGIAGRIRTGGFGGAEGLTRFLRDRGVAVVIDATHPFAATMSRNAAVACAAANVPWLMLKRPSWRAQPSDRWVRVNDAAAAAVALPGLGCRVFLSTGRKEIPAFGALSNTWFLVRLIDPPTNALPLRHYELILARGPFDAENERALLDRYRIDLVVSKNSGGGATYGKIAAARARNIPVVMIERPPLPIGPLVETSEDAVAWLEARFT